MGDIVEINRPEEWAIAKLHLDKLRGVVPFGLTVGNHDMKRDGDASLFQHTFAASSFNGNDWYLECYSHDREDQHVSANNVNSAQLFSAGGINFVFSGDQSRVTALRKTTTGDHGNEVHALLSDYMSRGGLRLLRFVPSKNQVQVITYDSTLDQLVESMPYVPDRNQHQFTIPYDFSARKQQP